MFAWFLDTLLKKSVDFQRKVVWIFIYLHMILLLMGIVDIVSYYALERIRKAEFGIFPT